MAKSLRRSNETMLRHMRMRCDGLNPTEIFCIVAFNLDTKTIYKFTKDPKDGLASIKDGVSLLSNADLLVGHNIIGFDNRVVDDLHGTSLNEKRCHDTFVMSQVLRYKRSHRHGLAGWGEHLGNSKWEFDDWEKYSPEMLKYCVQDVKVNVDIYNALLEEYMKIYANNPMIKEGLRVEHDVAVFNATSAQARLELRRRESRCYSEDHVRPYGSH